MLPTDMPSSRGGRMGGGFHSGSLLPPYLRRALSSHQMDWEYAFTQMVYCCTAPWKVYKLTTFRKQTKDQWARDDPAFVFIMTGFLLIAAVAYGICFRISTAGAWVWLFAQVLLQFFVTGAVVATFGWWLANKYLRVHHAHSVEQEVEWLYAFDIHCNGFFPLFVLLYVVQYILLPFLLNGGFLAMLVGNTLYLGAFLVYHYITFGGYTALPFLHKTEVFLYPMAVLVVAFLMAVLGGFSVPAHVLGWYLA